ncbi:MAG: 1-acyl-sn-glycerol-3-phosphate acyltransferase [Deltaproteobacteria bacterium]|nr:1-acyl-sn-glycerol-3-phosphate acyltransferase [Deltaproteobacteria bacterium]
MGILAYVVPPMSLFHFTEDRKKELKQRVIDNSLLEVLSYPQSKKDELIEDMIYWETQRVKRVSWGFKKKRELSYWNRFRQRYVKTLDEEDKAYIFKEAIFNYTDEIVGNFNPKTYRFSVQIIPRFLDFLMNASSLKRFYSYTKSFINENLVLTGDLERIGKLSHEATLIYTPTHVSNLDSILIGTALHQAGLDPVMYGAGLNLFRSKLIGYFMKNLGAYKVDRLKVHELYKNVLKEYTTSSLEMGFHNLFFPGGTRSRSGAVEKKLKLGLMGGGIKAYIRNLQHKKKNKNIFVIPMNLSSHLTLEAETLIDDFLRAVGKSRYIIENDEFSKPQRIFSFLKTYTKLHSKTFIHFGDPLDLFGNQVDQNGVSMDRHGRTIDIQKYVEKNRKILLNEDRDQNYTRELGQSLLEVFHKNNRVLSTHLVAFTLYEYIASQNKGDIYQFSRKHAYFKPIPVGVVCEQIDVVRKILSDLSAKNKISYSDSLRKKTSSEILHNALRIFATYHKRKTIYRKGNEIYIGDIFLLYYYHNRLVGYNIEGALRGSL